MAMDPRWPEWLKFEAAVRRARIKISKGAEGRSERMFLPREHREGRKKVKDAEPTTELYEENAIAAAYPRNKIASVTVDELIALYKRQANAEIKKAINTPQTQIYPASRNEEPHWFWAQMPNGSGVLTNGHMLLCDGGQLVPEMEGGRHAVDADAVIPRALSYTWDEGRENHGRVAVSALWSTPAARLWMDKDGTHKRKMIGCQPAYFALAMLWCSPGGKGVTVRTANAGNAPLIFLPPGSPWDQDAAVREGGNGRFALVMPMRID